MFHRWSAHWQKLGVATKRVSSPAELAGGAAPSFFPESGTIAAIIRALEENNLRAGLVEAITAGVPFLGICLGLQALYSRSEEAPSLTGLKLFPGSVAALPLSVKASAHGLEPAAYCSSPSRLLEGITNPTIFTSHIRLRCKRGSQGGCGNLRTRCEVRSGPRTGKHFRDAISPGKKRRSGCAASGKLCEAGGMKASMSLARRIIPCLDTDGVARRERREFCRTARRRRSRGAGRALQHGRCRRIGGAGYRERRAIGARLFWKRSVAWRPNWRFH